ncbi:hypothetical protein N9N67_09520 [Bacteriovoracaceae bacterium]|nr:hypothetical protein [Bacteriovoracaceae bacterium]
MQITNQKILLIIFSSFLLVSCGNRMKYVTDVKVTPDFDQGDVWINSSAKLNIGNITLPNLTLPILVPGLNRNVGEVEIVSNSDHDLLKINVNLSEIINLNTSESTLPNGKSLPLIGENEVIQLNLGRKKNAYLYLTMNDNQLVLGTAIAIGGMDFLGNTVGTAALFPAFNIKNVIGAAGIFTSKDKGESGLGIFFDLSDIVPSVIFEQKHTQALQVIEYKEVMPSSSKEQKLNRAIYRMHRKKAVIKE